MPTLSNKAREDIRAVIQDELKMVNARAELLAGKYWQQAEREVAQELGYGDAVSRIEFLKNQIEGLQTELSRLEGTMIEHGQKATVEDFRAIDIEVSSDRYGNVWGHPHVFGRTIETLWDTLVLAKLNETLPFFRIYKGLSQLEHVVRRELLLCGNYTEARQLYQQFHLKVIEAIGDQMPGLLTEVEAMPALQRPLEAE